MSVLRKFSKVAHHDDHRKSSAGDLSPQSSAASGSPHPANRRSIAAILKHFSDKESSATSESETDSDVEDDGESKNAAAKRAKKQHKKELKARASLEGRDDSLERLKQRLEEALSKETDDMRSRYGDWPLPVNYEAHNRIEIDTINDEMIGQEVTFRARLHHHRNMGQKLLFIIFKQRLSTIQGVMVEEAGKTGPLMLHWVEHLRTGTIVRVKGVVQKPAVAVKSASMHNIEIKVTHLHVIAKRTEPGKSHECLRIFFQLTCHSALLRSGSRTQHSRRRP